MLEEVKELLDEKIHDIFSHMQAKLDITGGDIDPWDALRLVELRDNMAGHIAKVLEYEKYEKGGKE